MKTQSEKIMDYCKEHGSITAYDGAYKLGILQFSARICELQEEYIKTSLLDNKNRVLRELWEMYERAVQAKPVMVWDKELKEYIPTGEYQFDDKIAMKSLEFIAKLGGMLSEKEGGVSGKKENFEIIVKVDSDED